MTEHYKEQHPLLCEEFSEEERYSPQNRRKPITYRNRARYHVKGAAVLFTRWPDHWSSFLVYLWIGLGMISLTTFILYNSLFTFSLLPISNSKLAKDLHPMNPSNNESSEKLLKPEVFMHAFYLPAKEVDLNKYLPHVEEISIKYPNFKYNLIIVFNDTISYADQKELDSAEINEIALHTIWSNDLTYHRIKQVKNINLEYITLSKYMDESALAKFWRELSSDVVEFLFRSLTVWEKGGIAFDPIILIPGSAKATYTSKLDKVFENYDTKNTEKPKNVNLNSNRKFKKRVNNIRDIIEALEHEDFTQNAQQLLDEAENRKSYVVTPTRKPRKIRTIGNRNPTDNPLMNFFSVTDKPILSLSLQENEINVNNSSKANQLVSKVYNNNTLLPSFLEYLFHGKHYNRQLEETPVVQLDMTTRTSINKINSKLINTDDGHGITVLDFTHKTTTGNSNSEITINDVEEEISQPLTSSILKNLPPTHNEHSLTIDLKGNIIATETPCHAFLGTLYSNAIHYPKPVTLTNFLISELSSFCKGLLLTCVGIDLILL